MNTVKAKGELNKILNMPLILLLIPAAANIVVYFFHPYSGIVMSVGILIFLIVLLIFRHWHQTSLMREMVTFATQYGQVQKQLILDFSFPYALTDSTGQLLWFNKAFGELTGRDYRHYQKSVSALFPNINKELLENTETQTIIETHYGVRVYETQISRILLNDLVDNSEVLQRQAEENVSMFAMVFKDETLLREYMQKYRDETLVCGLIYLDNYDEALESVEDVRRSLLTALIDRKINAYFHDLDGIVRKFEKDKYIVVMRSRTLQELKDLRFNILEDVKTVNIGNEMSVTLSIGIGANTGSYTRNAESARGAIDLALGRGGDQVVIRDGESISYFGGKTQAVEKNTRVKARVKAHALKEFIDSTEKVVVMGHKIMDIDAFGAAVGIYRAAETLGKRAYIVVDDPNTSTGPFIAAFRNSAEYEKDMLLTVSEAYAMVDEDTLLVVVDTNKPDYTESEELLQKTHTVVVLDHHRQSGNDISDSVLSYIEPYASSSCEMVSEILQYFPEEVRIRNIEADTIYAGILVDTDNFMQKTGVRTFEAAAFLRRNGADTTRIRKMFRGRIEDYRVKGEVLKDVEMYREHFAISICPSEGVESPTILASQAANELLDIVNVKASFVLTEYKETIYISARSIDEINVQIIMERMGGGGHLNIAGCQQYGISVEEARDKLKQVLDEMLEGGEIG